MLGLALLGSAESATGAAPAASAASSAAQHAPDANTKQDGVPQAVIEGDAAQAAAGDLSFAMKLKLPVTEALRLDQVKPQAQDAPTAAASSQASSLKDALMADRAIAPALPAAAAPAATEGTPRSAVTAQGARTAQTAGSSLPKAVEKVTPAVGENGERNPVKSNAQGHAGAQRDSSSENGMADRGTAVKDARRSDTGQALAETTRQVDVPARGTAVTVPDSTAPATRSAGAQAAAASSPTTLETTGEPQVKPTQPLKDVSIQVGQQSQERVNLRLVERAGELQVAVRAANPEVAQGLRQGISQLVDRLEQSGFRTEAWRPGGSVTPVQGAAETRQKSSEFQNDSSQGQSGGGSQQQRRQGDQQQAPRPQWVMELEGNLAGSAEPLTGESHGFSS